MGFLWVIVLTVIFPLNLRFFSARGKVGQELGQPGHPSYILWEPPSDTPICDIIKFWPEIIKLFKPYGRKDGPGVMQYPPSATLLRRGTIRPHTSVFYVKLKTNKNISFPSMVLYWYQWQQESSKVINIIHIDMIAHVKQATANLLSQAPFWVVHATLIKIHNNYDNK